MLVNKCVCVRVCGFLFAVVVDFMLSLRVFSIAIGFIVRSRNIQSLNNKFAYDRWECSKNFGVNGTKM